MNKEKLVEILEQFEEFAKFNNVTLDYYGGFRFIQGDKNLSAIDVFIKNVEMLDKLT